MATVTLHLLTPKGHPLDLTVSPEDEGKGKEIQALIERATVLADWFVGQGWGFAQPGQPALGEQKALTGPTFCGYPCSPTINTAGLPSWIIVDGRQADRHEKQGDTWWSLGEGPKGERKYRQVLRIAKGETVPPVLGLPAA
jgi:hypothetical protein